MSAKRHKSQGNLERRRQVKAGSHEWPQRAEAQAAAGDETDPAWTQATMEACVATLNMREAWKRVKENDGAPGVDGLSVEATEEKLRQHWPSIRTALLEGCYLPQAVRSVEIPKPSGGTRQLGIPTVTDRLIQQALLQVLQPIWDTTFHPHSFGFRPGKSAHDAVRQAQQYIQEGRKWVVDVDLEKFFDRVNHDILMERVAKRLKDKRVKGLIRRYLGAGMMQQGVKREREEGTPQGGPLSPLLANLLLNEVDWALEARGLTFCRYADDCNVYVKSKAAAEQAMRTMRKLTGKLKLKINEAKSAVARATARKFLGFQVWHEKSQVKLRVATETLQRFKTRIRQLTKRSCGRNVERLVGAELRPYVLGWKNYFRLAQTPRKFQELDAWIRRRLRVIHLKQWKTWQAVHRNLVARGVTPKAAESMATNRRRYWAISAGAGLNVAFPISYFNALGLPRLGA